LKAKKNRYIFFLSVISAKNTSTMLINDDSTPA